MRLVTDEKFIGSVKHQLHTGPCALWSDLLDELLILNLHGILEKCLE